MRRNKTRRNRRDRKKGGLNRFTVEVKDKNGKMFLSHREKNDDGSITNTKGEIIPLNGSKTDPP